MYSPVAPVLLCDMSRWAPLCARRRSSSSGTSSSSWRSGTSRRIRSPVRTSAERAADSRLRCDMQHDGAERGAAHPRIGDADHVLDAGLRQLLRDRQVAGLRHARRALRSGIAQHEDVVRGYVERRVVDPARQVFDRVEHDGTAGMYQQLG